MLIKLNGIEKAINKYNARLDELKKEYPKEFAQENHLKSLDDIMYPLHKENDYSDAPKGFYVCGLNTNHSMYLTDYKIINEYGYGKFKEGIKYGVTDWRSEYGVCDNHNQILKQYPELLLVDTKYIVFMTPIFKELQSENGGWRWHKWGRYIGNQNSKHEYLADEEDIDMVFVYHIHEVEKNLAEDQKSA